MDLCTVAVTTLKCTMEFLRSSCDYVVQVQLRDARIAALEDTLCQQQASRLANLWSFTSSLHSVQEAADCQGGELRQYGRIYMALCMRCRQRQPWMLFTRWCPTSTPTPRTRESALLQPSRWQQPVIPCPHLQPTPLWLRLCLQLPREAWVRATFVSIPQPTEQGRQ